MHMRASILALGLALGACVDDGAEGTEESQIAVGCMHFEHGPHCSSPEADGDDPPCEARAKAHQHFEVDLDQGRTLELEVELHASHYLLLGAASEVTITDSDGDAVEPKSEEAPGDQCTAATRAIQYELHHEVYTLTFTGSGVLDLVVHRVAAGAHDHDHHGH